MHVLVNCLDRLMEWALQVRLMIRLAVMMGDVPMRVINRPLPDIFQPTVQQRQHVL